MDTHITSLVEHFGRKMVATAIARVRVCVEVKYAAMA